MNKGLILYKSKYGSTKKYVEMIKKEIPCDVFEVDSCQGIDFTPYDFILIAGGLYAGGISGLKFLKKNMDALKGKKVLVFAVGASPLDERELALLKQRNFGNLPFEIPLFYGRGAYDEKKMTITDRTLCRLLKKSLSRKDPADFEPWMKALFESGNEGHDWTDSSYLIPLFRSIRGA